MPGHVHQKEITIFEVTNVAVSRTISSTTTTALTYTVNVTTK